MLEMADDPSDRGTTMPPAYDDPASLLHEDVEPGGAKGESPPVTGVDRELKQRARRTSDTVFSAAAASTRYNSAYDVGGKGYQDVADKIVEKFDRNKDGNFSQEEVKDIVLSLLQEKSSKETFLKFLKAALFLLVLSWVGNFGLTWATLSLTRKLDTHGGALTDASGRAVSTHSRGRLLHVDLGDEEERLRRLQAGGDAIVLREGPEQVHQDYLAVTQGDTASFSLISNGVVYTGTLQAGITLAVVDGKHVYSSIHVNHDELPRGPYKVTCDADADTCSVAVDTAVSSHRTLEVADSSDRREVAQNNVSERKLDQGCTKCNKGYIRNDDTTDCCDASWCASVCEDAGGQLYSPQAQPPTQPPKCESCGFCTVDGCNEQTNCCDPGAVLCFSPMSTIREKTKGTMLLKDLQLGDSVLAANGIYQPYVLSGHSNPTKPTRFVQIHTDGASRVDAPLEATPEHLIFVTGRRAPIPARDVVVGDSLVGTDGPRRVTRVAAVDRVGFFAPLTADGTLFVDGVLASSIVAFDDDGSVVNFGFAKVHVHSLLQRVVAPLFHWVCTRYDPRHCAAQHVTEDGDSYSVVIGAGIAVLRMPLAFRPLLLLLPAVALVSFVAYYAAAAALVAGLALAVIRASGGCRTKGKSE